MRNKSNSHFLLSLGHTINLVKLCAFIQCSPIRLIGFVSQAKKLTIFGRELRLATFYFVKNGV